MDRWGGRAGSKVPGAGTVPGPAVAGARTMDDPSHDAPPDRAPAGTDRPGTDDVPPTRLLLDAAPDAMVLTDEQGLVHLVNDELTRLLGYSAEELIGSSVDQLVPPELVGVHRAHRTRYRAAPRRRPMGTGIRLRARHRDGRDVPVEIGLSPITVDGRLWVLASLRDATYRLEMEREQGLVTRAIDSTTDAVFVFDRDDLTYLYVNRGAEEQTGYSREELLDMTPLHIAPDLDRAGLERLLEPLADHSLRARTLVTTHRRKDGVDVPVEITLEHPHVTDPSPPAVFVAIARDVSDRRPPSESPYRSAFRHHLAPTAIVDNADGEPRLREANDRFVAALGRSVEELRDQPLASIVSDEDASLVAGLLDGPATGSPAPTMARLLGVDGPLWAEIRTAPLEDEDDRILLQFHDVTARVDAESERDRHRKALDLMAERERIARDLHDRVIQRLFAAGMRLQAVAPLTEERVAERVDETVDELDGTIAELRAMIFRLGEETPVEFADRVRRSVLTRASSFGLEADIEVEPGIDPDEETTDHLLAVLGEALTNVGRHAGASQVTVSITADGRELALDVADDGIGFPPDPPAGHGIDNMMWRASQLGGRCVIEPGPDEGTRLRWTVPLSRRDPASS